MEPRPWEWGEHGPQWSSQKLCPHSSAPSTVQIPSSSLHKAHLGRNHAHGCVRRPSPFRLDGWGEKMWESIGELGGWSTMLMILKVDIPITNRSSKGIWAIKTRLFFLFSFALYKGVRSSIILIVCPSIDYLWLITTLNR